MMVKQIKIKTKNIKQKFLIWNYNTYNYRFITK